MSEQVEPLGLDVFDIDPPGPGGRGVLRLFIRRKDGSSVTVDDCASVSRRIINHIDVEAYLPGDTALEVSSPGVNRRLRLLSHFLGAVGERVSVRVVNPVDGKKTVIRGALKSAESDSVTVINEENGETNTFPFSAIIEARVDYPFDRKEGEKWSAKEVSN